MWQSKKDKWLYTYLVLFVVTLSGAFGNWITASKVTLADKLDVFFGLVTLEVSLGT